MAFGFNMQDKTQSQQSSSSGNSFVWGQQAPFLSSLWQGATNLAGAQQGVGGAAQGLVGQALPGIFDAFGSMGNIAQGNSPLAQFANPNNALISQQLGVLGSSLGDMFNTQIMPALNSSAVQAGGLGGSRHNLAAGQAAGDIGQAFTAGATDILGNAYNTAANSANALTQSMMGAAGAMGGMGADIFNLGMSPFNAAWAPMQNLGGLLGGPTILNQQQSQSSGTSNASGFGFNVGGNSLLPGSIFG